MRGCEKIVIRAAFAVFSVFFILKRPTSTARGSVEVGLFKMKILENPIEINRIPIFSQPLPILSLAIATKTYPQNCLLRY